MSFFKDDRLMEDTQEEQCSSSCSPKVKVVDDKVYETRIQKTTKNNKSELQGPISPLIGRRKQKIKTRKDNVGRKTTKKKNITRTRTNKENENE